MAKNEWLEFKPTPRQFECWQYLTDATTTEIGYGGAAGGGKTLLGCYWLLGNCVSYAGTAWVMGRRELNNLKRTTLLTFLGVCRDQGLIPGKDYVLNSQANTITFENSSVIFLFDLSNQPSDPLYTRLGSLELTGAFVDESNEIPELAIQILSARCGRKLNEQYAIKPKIFETFNPDKGHVYQRFYKLFREQRLPEFRKFVPALWSDNPFLANSYIDQLRHLRDEKTKQRLLYGNFEYDDDPSTLIEYDNILDLFTNPIPEGQEKYLTCDVARFGDDKTIICLWDGWRCYKIIKCEKQGLDVTADLIRQTADVESIPWSHVAVDEGGVGGGVVDMLRGIRGFVGGHAAYKLRDGDKAHFANLRSETAFRFADLANEHRIRIECADMEVKQQIVEELEQLKAKDTFTDQPQALIPKDEIKIILGRSPDYADALTMRAFFEVAPSLKEGMAHQFVPSSFAYRKQTPKIVFKI
jgi:phage terminase large subunit